MMGAITAQAQKYHHRLATGSGSDCQHLIAFAGSRKNQVNRMRSGDSISGFANSMTISLPRKQMGVAASCVMVLGSVPGVASAQIDPATNGYVTDQRGGLVKRGDERLTLKPANDPL
jgi:hypothetical protein